VHSDKTPLTFGAGCGHHLVIDETEVFEAKMVCGGQIESKASRSVFLIYIFYDCFDNDVGTGGVISFVDP
jgi:hypothetical protein